MKSSSASPSFSAWKDLVILAPALALVAAVAVWFSVSRGYTLYYGDAEAHLNIARSVIDSRTPGPAQLGTVWLPLPHLFMVPFASRDSWWHSGVAGAIPSAACFVVAGVFLFASMKLALGSRAAAWTSAALFGLNPNVLYLSSIPMTEPTLWAGLFGLMFTTIWFGRSGSWWALMAAALFSNWASLTRYEGWFLIPFVTAYILVSARGNRWLAAAVFAALACIGPLAWIARSYWYTGNPFDFYNGPYSAKAIQAGKYYPGQGEWLKAWLYFRTAVRWCAGSPLCWLGVVGIFAASWKKAFWPIFLVLLAPLFYVISIHGQGNPVFLPDLWTKSYYNSRYGLAAMPFLVLSASAIVALAPPASRAAVGVALIIAASIPWLLHPSPDDWICWKESQVNSEGRRALTREAGPFLRAHYRPGDGILLDFGDQIGILREADIPIREALHNGNNPAFMAAVQRPDLFLHERWAITLNGDEVDKAMVKTVLRGPKYVLAKTVIAKGAGPVQIHERVP